MSRIPVPAAILAVALLAMSPLSTATAISTPIPIVVTDDGPITWSVEPMPTSEGGRRAFTYEVDPGTQIQDSFLITNAGDTAAEFIIYATDAFNDPDTGNFSLLAHEATATDLGAWITPADEKLTIGPGLQATVPFNLLIPSDATPGDHSAGIVASVLTETEQDGSTVLLEQRVGVRMYLTVSGEPVTSVEVQGLTSSFTPSLNPFAPGEVTVSYDVRNTGNKRVDVTQALHIEGIFGIPVGGDTPDPLIDLLPRGIVHVTARIDGVGALLYAQSTVTITPVEVGTAVTGGDSTAGGTPTPNPTPTPTPTQPTSTDVPTPAATEASSGAPEESEVAFEKASEQTTTIAVSWTLLILIILIIAGIYLGWRYVTGTRERMYAAIDEAAEAARLEAEQAARAEAAEVERVRALEAERAAAAQAKVTKPKPAAKKPAAKKPAAKKPAAKKPAAKKPAEDKDESGR